MFMKAVFIGGFIGFFLAIFFVGFYFALNDYLYRRKLKKIRKQARQERMLRYATK